MSKWSGRPVTKNSSPRKWYARTAYRDAAFPYLCKDFEDRCAYSLLHISQMSKMVMEVDHFDPRKKDKNKQVYTNLVIAYRPCNNSKRAQWPTRAQAKLGMCYLNPRIDIDYGKHLFEDPDTHKIFGVTEEGKWHVEKLNLNDEFLVKARAQRARWKMIIENESAKILEAPQGRESTALNSAAELRELYAKAIPALPEKKNPEPDLDDLEKMITGS